MSDSIKITVMKEIEEIMPIFLGNRQEDIVNLTKAISETDFKTIEVISHKLKGNAGAYGIPYLSELGGIMETASQNEQMEPISECLEKMTDYLSKLEISYE